MHFSPNDRPFWPMLVFYAAMFAAIFSSPPILDEPARVVRASEIPYLWLLVVVGVSLLGYLVSEEVYEWPTWDSAERGAFSRGLLAAAIVMIGSLIGIHYLAAQVGWTYGTAGNVMLVPILAYTLFRFLKRPRKQLWD